MDFIYVSEKAEYCTLLINFDKPKFEMNAFDLANNARILKYLGVGSAYATVDVRAIPKRSVEKSFQLNRLHINIPIFLDIPTFEYRKKAFKFFKAWIHDVSYSQNVKKSVKSLRYDTKIQFICNNNDVIKKLVEFSKRLTLKNE